MRTPLWYIYSASICMKAMGDIRNLLFSRLDKTMTLYVDSQKVVNLCKFHHLALGRRAVAQENWIVIITTTTMTTTATTIITIISSIEIHHGYNGLYFAWLQSRYAFRPISVDFSPSLFNASCTWFSLGIRKAILPRKFKSSSRAIKFDGFLLWL